VFKPRLLLLVLALAGALATTSTAATKIERVVSPLGIEAWLVRETSIPILSMEVAWTGAARGDPAGKAGLANLVSGLIDEGAGDLDSQAFQMRLKDLSIELSFDAGRDVFSGTVRTLSDNKAEAFRLFGSALTAPRFDAEPVDRIRRQILTRLNRNRTDPRSIVGRTWYKVAFPEHAYGDPTIGTEASVKAITTDDMRDFVGKRIAKDNMIIAVVGDMTAAELAGYLDRTFGALPAKAVVPAARPSVPPDKRVVRVVQQQSPQSIVMFGMRGIARDDPDYYAAYVMNHVLGGGGLTSRLSQSVREDRGLTYSIYSYLYPLKQSSLFMGGFAAGNANVAEALKLTDIEIERLRDGGVTEEELADTKTYLNGSFPLRLTSNGRIAGILVSVQRHDLGIDYLERRAGLINAVTRQDIARVAARLLRPDSMIVVIVGNPAGIEETG